MADLLVRLYDLPDFPATERVRATGVTIRRAMSPEREYLLGWIGTRFSHHWIGEASAALSRSPVTAFVAVKDATLLGFSCYDTTAKGFFGPIGVDEATRGQGIGDALLIATLRAMEEAGYGYAVIGSPGPTEFYQKRLETFSIPGSDPGIYKGMLRQKADLIEGA